MSEESADLVESLDIGTVTRLTSDAEPKSFTTLMDEASVLRKQLERVAGRVPNCTLPSRESPSLISMSVAALDQYVPPLLAASASMNGGYYTGGLRVAVGTWDGYRGRVESGVDVMGTGARIARFVHSLAKELTALPPAASDPSPL